MPDAYVAKTNFTAGEWSSRLAGRVDLAAFANAVKLLENWLVRPQGGVKTRPGTKFVADIRLPVLSTAARLIPFEFNVTQAYIIEATNLVFRFHTNQGRLEEAGTAISNAADNGSGLIRITSTAHGLNTNEFASITGVSGTIEANGDFQVTRIDANNFDLQASAFVNTYISTTSDFAAQIIELVTPYLAADLFQLKFAQTADIMYIVHPDHQTRKLTRTSATSFTLTAVTFVDGPYQAENTDTSKTLTPSVSAVDATGTLTSVGFSPFTVDHVGSLWRLNVAAAGYGYVEVTGFVSALSVNMVVRTVLGGTSATSVWREGSFSDEAGHASAITFFENRLILAGTPTQPQTIFGSATDAFETFTPGVADDDAFEFTIATRQANVIRWLVPQNVLFMGTSGREFKITGGNDQPITPTNILVRAQTVYGSANIQGLNTESTAVFVQRATLKLRQLRFDVLQDQFLAADITILNPEVTGTGIIEIAFEQENDPRLWAVTTDGNLAVLTILGEQNVIAWARVTTNGTWESVETIPVTAGNEVWAIAKRTVETLGGTPETRRYVEFFDSVVNTDSAIRTDFGSPVTTVTGGLRHLEAQTVRVIGDGAVYPDQVVNNHALPDALDPAAQVIEIGLPFTPKINLFQPEKEFREGSAQGRRIKIGRMTMLVDNTTGLTVNDAIIPTRSTADPTGVAPPPFTGELEISPDSPWDIPPEIRQDLSLPAEILALFLFVEVGN